MGSLSLDITRNGASVTRYESVFSATRKRALNAADIVTATVPPRGVRDGDMASWIEDGIKTAEYVVMSVEPAMRVSQPGIVKLTLAPAATVLLLNTGFPGVPLTDATGTTQAKGGYLDGNTLSEAVDRIQSLVGMLTGFRQMVDIQITNTDSDIITTEPVDTDNESTRVIDADTALKAMDMITQPSNLRWRCRADITAMPTVQIGTFGDHSAVEIRSVGNAAPDQRANEANKVYGVMVSETQWSSEDIVTGVFAEGGNYTEQAGQQRMLIPLNCEVPGGFTRHIDNYPDGSYYVLITKDFGVDYVPYTNFRTRRIHASSIAPKTNKVTGRTTSNEVDKAELRLMKAITRYLEMYADGKYSCSVSAPFAMSLDFNPGDMVYGTIYSGETDRAWNGWLYVLGHMTEWSGGAVSSTLELSNKLDPSNDPLSEQYAGMQIDQRLTL